MTNDHGSMTKKRNCAYVMVATEEQIFPSRITARLFAWLAPLLFLFAALAAVPVSATASAKALCVPHNCIGGNSTSAVQWCPAQGPRTGALNWEKLPGEYVPGGSGFANAARMAGQISADWTAENSGELGGLRPTYDEVAIATSGPVGELGDAVAGKVAETVAPAVKGVAARLAEGIGEKLSSLGGKAIEAIARLFGEAGENGRPLAIDSGQLGAKLGKHMEDFGLDPANPIDRQTMVGLIRDIGEKPDRVVTGAFRGQGVGGTRGPVEFRIKGSDVVVTKPDGRFVTILRNGLRNSFVMQALKDAGR